MSDWYENFLAEQAAKVEAAMNGPRRDELFATLKAHGVKQVVVGFDGSGDSGQITEVTLTGAAGESIGRKESDAILAHQFQGTARTVQDWSSGKLKETVRCEDVNDRIEQLCYDLLYGARPGWEINEGSFGEFVFDVDANEIHLTHNQRIESYETSEESF